MRRETRETRETRDTPVVLTIGSSDSSGGAGIQGDIKALASVGCYAATVLVGVTAQNTRGVISRFSVPVAFVVEQIDAVLADVTVDAVKIGMTWSDEHVAAVARRMASLDLPIVVDPVMVTAAGAALTGLRCVATVVEHLFPIADVITPNVDEARMLVGDPAASPQHLAERLLELGARAAVVTCGGADGGDWFAHRSTSTSTSIARVGHRSGAEHGAGCAHSVLIAGLRARGLPILDAVAQASQRAAIGVRDGLTSIGGGVHPVDLLGLGQHRLTRVA
jgi:hydroxymethylpyrimidine/phosphomethylpyrimidine kinase